MVLLRASFRNARTLNLTPVRFSLRAWHLNRSRPSAHSRTGKLWLWDGALTSSLAMQHLKKAIKASGVGARWARGIVLLSPRAIIFHSRYLRHRKMECLPEARLALSRETVLPWGCFQKQHWLTRFPAHLWT